MAARRRVASENHAAARLDPHDARWAFAVRVTHTMEGGRSGILAPERRHRLVSQARAAGLREFDANLIIAIVQDSVRSGQAPLGPDTESRLTLVRPPSGSAGSARAPLVRVLVATVVAAAALLAILIRWVLG